MTIDELCDQYERFAAIYYRQPGSKHPTGTLKNIRDALRVLRDMQDPTPAPGMLWQDRDRRIGDLPADLMTAKLLKAIQRAQADQGLARRTVNDRIAWIQRMFCWAADPEQELLPEDVCAKVRMVKPLRPGRSNAAEPPPRRSVSYEAVRATALFATPMIRTMIHVLWHTGMRAGEVCRMRKSEINRDGPIWIYEPAHHKTEHHGRQRIIPLGPKCQQALTAWWDQARTLPGAGAGAGAGSLPGAGAGDLLFEGGRFRGSGRPITRQAFYNAIRRINMKYGLDDWGLHQVRKAFATRVARKFSERDAQLLLDHADVDITRRHYIDPDLQRKIELMEEIG